MMTFSFPTDLTQITPELVTQVLRVTGALHNTSVSQLDMEKITGETSFNAQVVRLSLNYDGAEVGAPRTLILKLPTANTALHANAAVFRPGTKENWFYRRVAPLNQLRVPKCYYSAVDAASGAGILLLEDLASAQRISQVTGISAAEARLALRSLAGLHAGWWEQQSASEIIEL